MHNLQSKKQAFEVEHAKPFTLHCSLLMLVLFYSFLGGFIFDRIETDAHAEMKLNERINRTACVSNILHSIHRWSQNHTHHAKLADRVADCFEPEKLKVRDLLHAVGKKCGVEPGMIDALDLENVVERTIAIQEGREPPDDLNEEPPREPSPRSIIHSPCSTRPSNPPMSPPSPREDHPFIFKIESPTPRSHLPMPIPIPTYELDIKKPIFQALSSDFMTQSAQEKLFDDLDAFQVELNTELVEDTKCESVIIIEPPTTFEHDELTIQNCSNFDDLDKEEKVPKRFREKKEMYGRDPRKLYETYQEEWDRLERLSDRKHGSRRKSVLNLASCSPERSTSPSPIRHSITGDDNRRNS
uniref:Uncharacterized protein n=1 Tax=Caenorhabditis japonica TaxID=281687 RepID=A0A8R1HRH0_CAEJA